VTVAVIRPAGIVLALVLCAWFGLGIVQAHDTNTATTIINEPGMSAKQAKHVRALLRGAGTLNPDLQVQLLRGRLALLENDRARAVGIFRDATRREPMNVQAWLLLAEAAYGNGPLINLAVTNISELDPRSAHRR
jgi:hypothetical protein